MDHLTTLGLGERDGVGGKDAIPDCAEIIVLGQVLLDELDRPRHLAGEQDLQLLKPLAPGRGKARRRRPRWRLSTSSVIDVMRVLVYERGNALRRRPGKAVASSASGQAGRARCVREVVRHDLGSFFAAGRSIHELCSAGRREYLRVRLHCRSCEFTSRTAWSGRTRGAATLAVAGRRAFSRLC